MKKFILHTLLVLPLALAALPAAAQQAARPAATQELVITASNRTAQAEASAGRRRADDRVRTGDVVRYNLTFTNTKGRALQGITLNDPVPAGLQFVAGSTRASRNDMQVEYSADGGKSFSTQPMEEVTIEGRKVRRAVAPERYTHVRWIVGGTVAPGASVTAEFDARLPAGARTSTAVSTPARPSGN